jgi:hypothetical protein
VTASGLGPATGAADLEQVYRQHVAPIPAGFIGIRPGPAFAAADGLRVTLYGRGAHGSRPEAGIDPVVMAAATVTPPCSSPPWPPASLPWRLPSAPGFRD